MRDGVTRGLQTRKKENGQENDLRSGENACIGFQTSKSKSGERRDTKRDCLFAPQILTSLAEEGCKEDG